MVNAPIPQHKRRYTTSNIIIRLSFHVVSYYRLVIFSAKKLHLKQSEHWGGYNATLLYRTTFFLFCIRSIMYQGTGFCFVQPPQKKRQRQKVKSMHIHGTNDVEDVEHFPRQRSVVFCLTLTFNLHDEREAVFTNTVCVFGLYRVGLALILKA